MGEISTICVTGGAGFIGSALIRKLLRNGSYNVVNIDKLTYAGNLESIPSSKQKNYFFYHFDINDSDSIQKCFEKHKPNIIMNLAAESHVDRSINGPQDFINTNILGTFNLLEKSREYFDSLTDEMKKNFVFHHISTDEVFGDLKKRKASFNENTPYNPSSPYSATKASSDHLVRAWGRTYGLPFLITNCSNNYGPYHFPEKFIPHLIINAIKGKAMPIYGDGKQIRDWLFVDDHVEALLQVAFNGIRGETYNIGGNSELTNIEVASMVCDSLELIRPAGKSGLDEYKSLITFVKDRPGHDEKYAIDNSKIVDQLNWKPKETFESGLSKTVKWYVNNQNWWENILSGNYRLERLGEIS